VQKLGRLPGSAALASGSGTGFVRGTPISIATVEQIIWLIIEASLSDGDSDTVNTGDGVLAVVKRRDCSFAQLALTSAEGHSRHVSINRHIAKEESSMAIQRTGHGYRDA
jgi:hypothetical protein